MLNDSLEILTWKDLFEAKFKFISQFYLSLFPNQLLRVEKVVRFAPQRRLVVFGKWDEKSVAAKLFIKPRHAKQKMKKDFAGIQILQKKQVLTPLLYKECTCSEALVGVLLFERIQNAIPFEKIYKNTTLENLLPKLKLLLSEIARQHKMGILQRDINLKNYLFADEKIYSIDGTGIESFPNEISRKESINNLAMFFSYFGISVRKYVKEILQYYINERNWFWRNQDVNKIINLIDQKIDSRWKRTQKKIFSESSHFSLIKEKNLNGMFDRDYGTPEFLKIIKNPLIVFDRSEAHHTEFGKMIAVASFMFGKQKLIVRQYSDYKHKRRQHFATSLASKSWFCAHLLTTHGIRTEKPVGFIETTLDGNNHSYYVSEYMSDQAFKLSKSETAYLMLNQIIELLKNLHQIGVSWEDVKSKNIFIKDDKQLIIAEPHHPYQKTIGTYFNDLNPINLNNITLKDFVLT